MDKKEICDIEVSLSKKRERKGYRLPIKIINKSSIGFQKAEVGVKDFDSNSIDTVYFGNIPSGDSAIEYADLPGGIEWVIFKILPDIGEEIVGTGLASNAPGVNITISD